MLKIAYENAELITLQKSAPNQNCSKQVKKKQSIQNQITKVVTSLQTPNTALTINKNIATFLNIYFSLTVNCHQNVPWLTSSKKTATPKTLIETDHPSHRCPFISNAIIFLPKPNLRSIVCALMEAIKDVLKHSLNYKKYLIPPNIQTPKSEKNKKYLNISSFL